MREFVSNHPKITIIIVGILVLCFLIRGYNVTTKDKIDEEKLTDDAIKAAQEASKGSSQDSDNIVLAMQEELIKEHGELPEGFVWDIDGTLLSLGDKSMSADDVVYAYFRGLSSLNLDIVELYSRDSSVLDTYSGYFDSTDKNTDYLDQFLRNMYKCCMLSIQVEGIVDQAVFAENKEIFTVKAKMLDLTDKDFWLKDKKAIFDKLYLYDSDESDSTKSDMFLYEYILSYYESGSAKMRDVTFNVTVQRYPDLDTGWLVSIDTDVNDACQYKDGKLVVSYIKEVFRDEGFEMYTEDY